ncbi:MAG: hypothetical protein ACXVBE_03430 [Bdellovibrionota bacterium]
MKSRVFPVAVIIHILLVTLTAHAAAPVTQLPTKVEIAKPESPVNSAAIPSPIEAAKNEYSKTALLVENNIKVVMNNSASCGMIGGMIADNLKQKNALAEQQNSRKQIESVLSEAAKDEKKRHEAAKRLDAEIHSIKSIAAEVDGKIDQIKMGLDTQTPTCRAANKAFFAIRSRGDVMIKSLNAAKKALNQKKANLLTDGAAYASSEASYDTATARVEFQREQAEERIESASAELN